MSSHKTPPPNTRSELEREIGLGVMIFYAVGVMIGGGIYVLIGNVAGLAGALTPLIFAVAGLAAGLTAASFAELSARLPEAGGSATYTLHGFNSQTLSIIVGFAVALTGLLSAGAVLQGGVGYLQALVSAPSTLLIVTVGIALTALAIWGALESLSTAAVLALIEILGLLIVIAAAFFGDAQPNAVDHSIAATAPPISLGPLMGAVILAFFAFIGFEDVVNMAEEARNPSRTMPLALLVSFVIVILIYGCVAVAALHVVTPAELQASERPLALVYEQATGKPASFIALIGVAAALNGVLAQIVMSARILLSLGRRTPALSWFGVTHPRLKTPMRATILTGTVVIILALTIRLEGLASATSLILLGVFVLINIALIRIKRTSVSSPFNLPIWIPYAGAIVSAIILVGALIS